MAHNQIGEKAKHLVSKIFIKSRNTDTHKSSAGSNSSILDVFSMDSQRNVVQNLKTMLQIPVERGSAQKDFCLVKLGLFGTPKEVGRMGYQKTRLFLRSHGRQTRVAASHIA